MRFNEEQDFDVLGYLDNFPAKVNINYNSQLYFFMEPLSIFPASKSCN